MSTLTRAHDARDDGVGDGAISGKALVRRLRSEAVRAWSDALGDSTACALAKSGRSYPAGKFHEGRAAALGELLHLVANDATRGQVLAAAATLREAWLHRMQLGGRANREWESYRAGGAQVLAELDAPGRLDIP
ncbi:hypothetical protein BH11ACT4_BH11ACT4_11060 [soil metagenome]